MKTWLFPSPGAVFLALLVVSLVPVPSEARPPRSERNQDYSIIGTWQAFEQIGPLVTIEHRAILKPDGTGKLIKRTHGQTQVVPFTYEYADGVIYLSHPLAKVRIPATITWDGPNRFTFYGSGQELVYTRQ